METQETTSTLRARSIVLAGLSAAFALTMSFLYVTHINEIATSGYALRDLTIEKARLADEHEKLQVEIARIQSLDQIVAVPFLARMTDIRDTQFAARDSRVALNLK